MARKATHKDTILPEVQFAESLIAFAIKGKRDEGISEQYERSKDYFNGKHKIRTRAPAKGNNVVNKYAEIFENRISHISEALPKWHFRPQDGAQDLFTAQALNQIIGDVIWDIANWEETGERAVDEAAHAGSCIIKTLFNKNTGYPVFQVIPNGQAFPDPIATNSEELRFFVHAYPMQVKEIKRVYNVDVVAEPKLEHYARSITGDDIELSYYANASSSAPSEVFVNHGVIDSKGRLVNDPGQIGQAMVFEVWFDDDDREKTPFDPKEAIAEHTRMMIDIPPIDAEQNHVEHIKAHKEYLAKISQEDAGQTNLIANLTRHIQGHYAYEPNETRPKYPTGRVLMISQGKKLWDSPNRIQIPWRKLFTKWDFFPRRGHYWGKSLGKDLFDPQDMLNHRSNAITQNINNLNNGVVLVRKNVLDTKGNTSKWNNLISKIIPVTDVTRDFKRDFGPHLQPHHFQDLVTIESHMERKGGHEGLTAGRFPSGSPAGVTVDALLGEAQKPINAVVRRYSRALKQMGRNAIAIMDQYLSKEEQFTILNDENLTEQVSWGDLKDRAGLLHIRVDVQGQMATSRQRKLAEAIELKREKIYDSEAVLKSIDDPMALEVLQRTSLLLQTQQALAFHMNQNEELKKLIKTERNRNQSANGEGNTGVKAKAQTN